MVSLQFHFSLPLIITSAVDNVVRVWDCRTGGRPVFIEIKFVHLNRFCSLLGNILSQLTGHQDSVTMVHIAPIWLNSASPTMMVADDMNEASDVVITVSDDKTARIFHLNAHYLLSHNDS